VVRFAITPVKSMQLQQPEEIRLERFGVAENRRFYVSDREGRLLSGAPHDRLIPLQPSYDSAKERLGLRFPDGVVVEGDVGTVHGPRISSSFWGRLVTGHEVEGPWSEALSEHVDEPVRLVRTDEPGQGIDSHAVSLFSSASAEELDRRAGRADRPHDRRRWRMLIEVQGCGPHEEDQWIGGRVRVGDAVIDVIRADPRCRITTLDPDTGQKDFDTLRVLAGYRAARIGELPFGVYGDVIVPGLIRQGDPVEPVAT
jgi:MOSC domain-containing protein